MKRRLQVDVSKDGKKIEAMGVDSNGAPYTLFKEIKVSGFGPTASIKKGKQPFLKAIPDAQPKEFGVELSFQGYYQEPDLHLKIDTAQLLKEQRLMYTMIFDAMSSKWELVLTHNSTRDMVGVAEFKQVKPAIAAN